MKIFGLKIEGRFMEGALSAKHTPRVPPPPVRFVPIDYGPPAPGAEEAGRADGIDAESDQV